MRVKNSYSSLTAEFLLGVMALNLIGILWTSLLINLYNMPTIELKISPKIVRFMERITLSKYHHWNPAKEGNEIPKENCITPKKEIGENEEEQKENFSAHENRVVMMIFDALKSILRQDENKALDYSKEWRFVTRCLDKILFFLNILLLTCAAIFIFLTNNHM